MLMLVLLVDGAWAHERGSIVDTWSPRSKLLMKLELELVLLDLMRIVLLVLLGLLCQNLLLLPHLMHLKLALHELIVSQILVLNI